MYKKNRNQFKLKIAFNIARRNWYRVLAAPINEALVRGWDVTCFHGNEEQKSQDDLPLPLFEKVHKKSLTIKSYRGVAGLTQLLKDSDFDVVVDADTTPIPLPEIIDSKKKVPLSVLLTGITHPRLQFGGKLPRFSLYLVPSQWQVDQTIEIMTRDHSVVLGKAERDLAWIGKKIVQDWKSMFINRWTNEDANYFRENSVVVGTPSLDDLQKIDPLEVRKRLGIPLGKRIVGLLPSPWDMPLGYAWGDLNMVQNVWELCKMAFAHRQLKQLPELHRMPKDKDFIKSISQFCTKNDAFLIAKLRKHRDAKSYLRNQADLIVGEDSFFPHTALELFAISDVCFGFCSTGAFECVAAGTPYVDINIPFFPKKEYIQCSTTSTEVTSEWKGVIYEMSAENAIKALPKMDLGDFRLNHRARTDYLKYFTSEIEGNRSAMMMDAIELKLYKKKNSA